MPRIPKNGWSKDRKHFNGKPIEYWKKMADKAVITSLVRAAEQLDTRSVPGEMAAKELMGMAASKGRMLFGEVLEERENWKHGVAMTFAEMLLPDEALKKIRAARRRAPKR